jgi:ComF family protein
LATERLLATGRRGVGLLLDVLLPPQCLTCDAPVGAPGQFCAACFRRTGFVTDPCCACCGRPFGSAMQGGASGLCTDCREHPPAWGTARAALRYDDQARRILLPFKHGDRIETVRALAPHMARAGAALLAAADWLVPVPLHRRRLLSRRYNQSALLAQHLSRLSGRPAVLDGLRRTRATPSLGHKTGTERRAEVADAFAVRPSRQGRFADSRVLLIDDVMTSGATADACARALLAAGVARVDVLVAARVADARLE